MHSVLSGEAGQPHHDAAAAAARGWFGYGRWDAPYWFIGMEPGGTDRHASCDVWLQLGGGELLDCKTHHLKSGNHRWHTDARPATQPTWRRLVQMLLAYKGVPTDLDSVRRYQRDRLGTTDEQGETALLELSALHAPSLSHVGDRMAHRDYRVRTIRERLARHGPTFALFYGVGYRQDYEAIVGSGFDADGFAQVGPTLCALTPHPTARGRGGRPPAWWTDLGRRVRRRVAARDSEG